MLRPCPVEVTLAATVPASKAIFGLCYPLASTALNGAFQPAGVPSIHFTSYRGRRDNRTLAAGADDDGIIFTVIVDAADMRPVAAASPYHPRYPRICRRSPAPPDSLRSTYGRTIMPIFSTQKRPDRGFIITSR